jgi:HSP20 family protein
MKTLTTTPWNPFRGMERIERRLCGLLEQRLPLNSTSSETRWVPPVDVAEDDKEYTLTADLPNVRKEDMRLTLQNGSITLTGERHRTKEEKGKTFYRLERDFGAFERSFTLPEFVDAEQIKAEFWAGTLTVHLPKLPSATKGQKEIAIG